MAGDPRRAVGTARQLDARGLRRPDLGTVDALARAALAARRQRRYLLVTNAGPELRRLLELVGLGDIVPCA